MSLSESVWQVDPLLGTWLGPYRILQPIGAGGMGAVYLALRDDDQFQKRVAIKVIRRGVDHADVVRRLAEERQTLAVLEHPYIVHLLDGGATPDGLPYLVMDYVEGEPLDRYSATRALALDARLDLFLRIASAVQYAHQNLVVHCDLKPGNILVTAGGTPRLLDFGVSRLLKSHESDEVRATARYPSYTPDYASPEQILAAPLTTATDVYSLGLILYELVTGVSAADPDSPIHVTRRMLQATLTLPSAAAPAARLDPDLDAIAGKALARNERERYRSVEQLAGDILRFRERRPVTARPATPAYLLRKFVERNRTSVAAAGLLALAVAGGLGATMWQARVAHVERTRAERSLASVRKLAHVLLFDFHDAVAKLPGTTAIQQVLVAKSVDALDSVARDSKDDSGVQLDLVDGYMKMGDLQGNPYNANLGDTRSALATYQKALALVDGMSADARRQPDVQRALAGVHRGMGEVLPGAGDLGGAVSHLRRAVAILEGLSRTRAAPAGVRADLASGYEMLGDTLGNPGLYSLGDLKGALESYRKSLAAWQAVASADPDNTRARRAQAGLLMKIGDTEAAGGANPVERYRSGLAILNALPAAAHDTIDTRRMLGMLDRKIGEKLAEQGDRQSAQQSFDQARQITEALAAADPSDSRAQFDLAVILKTLAEFAEGGGDRTTAAGCYSRVVDILEKLSRDDPENLRWRGLLSEMYVVLGGLLADAGNEQEGRSQTTRGIALMKSLADRPNAPASDLERLASTLAECRPQSLRDPAAAQLYARRAAARKQ